MADWGSFAGGVARGYTTGEELKETRKRTKAIEDEAGIRKQREARDKEDFEIRKRDHERTREMQDRIADVAKNAKWVAQEDGSVDPLDPANAGVWDQVLGKQITIYGEYGKLPLNEIKSLEEHRAKMKDKGVRESATQFYATMNPEHLSKIDPKYKGSKMIQERGENGITTNSILLTDGTKVPMAHVHAVTGDIGSRAQVATNLEEDNRRAAIRDQESARHNRTMEGLAAKQEARMKQDFEARVEAGKVTDILAVKRYVADQVIQKPEKDPLTGKMNEADPLWNDSAEGMIADRMKKYGTKPEGIRQAAAEADEIKADVRTSLRELDARVAAKAKADGKTDPKDIAKAREHAHKQFKRNGYVLPPVQEQAPQAQLPPEENKRRMALIPS